MSRRRHLERLCRRMGVNARRAGCVADHLVEVVQVNAGALSDRQRLGGSSDVAERERIVDQICGRMVPMPPTCPTSPLNAYSRGRCASTVAASPPTMMTPTVSIARTALPETGASSIANSFDCIRAAHRCAETGASGKRSDRPCPALRRLPYRPGRARLVPPRPASRERYGPRRCGRQRPRPGVTVAQGVAQPPPLPARRVALGLASEVGRAPRQPARAPRRNRVHRAGTRHSIVLPSTAAIMSPTHEVKKRSGLSTIATAPRRDRLVLLQYDFHTKTSVLDEPDHG